MAMTYGETKETRIIFQLQSDNGTGQEFKTRTIAVPGQPTESTQTAFLAAVRAWRAEIVGGSHSTSAITGVFIQPSGWRDDTGSTSTTDVPPYKTVGLEVELYTVQRTKWEDEDLQST